MSTAKGKAAPKDQKTSLPQVNAPKATATTAATVTPAKKTTSTAATTATTTTPIVKQNDKNSKGGNTPSNTKLPAIQSKAKGEGAVSILKGTTTADAAPTDKSTTEAAQPDVMKTEDTATQLIAQSDTPAIPSLEKPIETTPVIEEATPQPAPAPAPPIIINNNGKVILIYEQYNEQFDIIHGSTTQENIDEVYCLSFVMPNCLIHLSILSSNFYR